MMSASRKHIAACNGSPPERMMRLVRPLLEQLLTRASRFQETPLQFEVDTAGVALAAWSSFSADLPEADRRLLSNGAQVRAALDLLIEQALEDDDPFNDTIVCDTCDHVLPRDGARLLIETVPNTAVDIPLVRIAEWLDAICNLLRTVDARAIDVIRLRIDGYGPRDIACRLNTGVRLVRRLLADIRELRQTTQQDLTSC